MVHNNKNRPWVPVLLIGATAGIGAYWFIRLLRDQQSRGLPSMPGWRKVLAEQHGEEKARMLLETVNECYAALLKACAMPAHPALRRHLKEHILPGLALYRALLVESNGDREAALAEIDAAFRARTVEQIKGMAAAMKMLPMPFWLFKIAVKLQMRSFPSVGWDFQDVETSDSRVAFNATRCFYLNTLAMLGAPELTASFCKSDEVMAEAFPTTIRFVRPHTLGRGDPLCDFQYCYRGKASES